MPVITPERIELIILALCIVLVAITAGFLASTYCSYCTNRDDTSIHFHSNYIGKWKGCDLDNQYEIYTFYENGTGVYINLLTFEKINTYWTQRSETWMTVKFHTFAGMYSNFDISFTMLNANRIVNKNGSFYKIGDA